MLTLSHALPLSLTGSRRILALSGGKDSAAAALALRENDVEAHHYVFADTGWEARETYAHLDTMERVLGITIDRVGVDGGMVAVSREKAGFPSGAAKWCTERLKLDVIRAYHERIATAYDTDTINIIGVRAEESDDRAKAAPWEFSKEWDGYVWRPILHATIEDVLLIHHRHGLPLNPLYHLGMERVGCWPCIRERKEGLAIIAEHDPARIDEIEAYERELSALRVERNAEKPGRYGEESATFFQKIIAAPKVDGVRPVNGSGRAKRIGVPFPIREAIAWSRTERGGVQLRLIQQAPSGGCFRWGLCEPPAPGGQDGE